MSTTPQKPASELTDIVRQLPDAHQGTADSFDVKGGEGYSDKLVDAIEMIGEETAAGGLFSLHMMYLANPVPEHVAIWAALIGLLIAALLMVLYVATVNHTTSDKRLQQVGK